MKVGFGLRLMGTQPLKRRLALLAIYGMVLHLPSQHHRNHEKARKMAEDTEAYRLAQMAMSEARDAKHIADIGAVSISSHEKICAERYEKINSALNTIPTLVSSITELRVEQARAISTNKMFAYVTVIVGLIYVSAQILGKI